MKIKNLEQGADYLMGLRFLGMQNGCCVFGALRPDGEVIDRQIISFPGNGAMSYFFKPLTMEAKPEPGQTEWWTTRDAIAYFKAERGREHYKYSSCYGLLKMHNVKCIKGTRGLCFWDAAAGEDIFVDGRYYDLGKKN